MTQKVANVRRNKSCFLTLNTGRYNLLEFLLNINLTLRKIVRRQFIRFLSSLAIEGTYHTLLYPMSFDYAV